MKSRDGYQKPEPLESPRPDVVLIMGFGATSGCWAPQLDELLGSKQPGGPPRARVLLLDNRGVGRSGSPESKRAYTTSIMATDIICLLVRSFVSLDFSYSICCVGSSG